MRWSRPDSPAWVGSLAADGQEQAFRGGVMADPSADLLRAGVDVDIGG